MSKKELSQIIERLIGEVEHLKARNKTLEFFLVSSISAQNETAATHLKEELEKVYERILQDQLSQDPFFADDWREILKNITQ